MRVSRDELREEEIRRRISALTSLGSDSVSLEVVVEPFCLEVPSSDVSHLSAASLCCSIDFCLRDSLFWLAGFCRFCCFYVTAPASR